MFDDSRKIHLIEEVLRIEDKAVLHELEVILERSKASRKQAFLKELRASVKEVKSAKRGKSKLQSAKRLMDEL